MKIISSSPNMVSVSYDAESYDDVANAVKSRFPLFFDPKSINSSNKLSAKKKRAILQAKKNKSIMHTRNIRSGL